METTLKDQFIAHLEEKYGSWDVITSRFGSTSFGAISQDLSISASQFSKLISGTATEGMYQRSIENINRIIQRESMARELVQTQAEYQATRTQLAQLQRKNQLRKQLVLISSLSAIVLAALTLYFGVKAYADHKDTSPATSHPLSAFFDRDLQIDANSPYVDLSQVQAFCPGSAYEGSWSLHKPYKLPIPSSKPGLYYYAKSADVRMKCRHYDTDSLGKGRVVMGYEALINEIWVDTKMTPLSPTYFDKRTKTFTPAFDSLSFEDNPQFRKVATIHSFFIDKFELKGDSVIRKGEPCGRYAANVDEELVAQYAIDLKYILEQVLGDLTTTHCAATFNPYCDPNTLQETESVLTFDCIYTIGSENLGMGGGYPYQKGYRLEQQHYADNLTCDCEG